MFTAKGSGTVLQAVAHTGSLAEGGALWEAVPAGVKGGLFFNTHELLCRLEVTLTESNPDCLMLKPIIFLLFHVPSPGATRFREALTNTSQHQAWENSPQTKEVHLPAMHIMYYPLVDCLGKGSNFPFPVSTILVMQL